MSESLGEAYVLAERYKDAIPVYLETLASEPGAFLKAECHLGLAIAYDALGRQAEAQAEIGKATEAFPDFTVSYLRGWNIYKDKEYAERWLATLARLGLPEE